MSISGVSLVGADIAAKMLTALTDNDSADSVQPAEIISLDEQKRYLLRHINVISRDDKKSIGDVVVRNNKRNELKWCSEGTIINLDAMPPHVITQMYELLKYKMEKK